MNMEPAEDFDKLSFGWVLPKYTNEDYILDGAKDTFSLNKLYEKGGHTHLTYEIQKRLSEWHNLIRRLYRGINMVGNYTSSAESATGADYVYDLIGV